MKILFHGNSISTPQQFLDDVYRVPYIHGLFVEVAKTKDDRIVILNPDSNQRLAVQKINNYTFQETKDSNFILLEDMMRYFQQIKKRLVISALIGTGMLTFKEVDAYTTALADIVNEYPDIDVSVCSLSHALIMNLKSKLKKAKIGVILEPANLNYIDVDFYIFSANMLDAKILRQQDRNGKESMISLCSWTGLQQTMNFFRDDETKQILTEEQIDRITLIGYYPEIIHRSIQDIQ